MARPCAGARTWRRQRRAAWNQGTERAKTKPCAPWRPASVAQASGAPQDQTARAARGCRAADWRFLARGRMRHMRVVRCLMRLAGARTTVTADVCEDAASLERGAREIAAWVPGAGACRWAVQRSRVANGAAQRGARAQHARRARRSSSARTHPEGAARCGGPRPAARGARGAVGNATRAGAPRRF